MNFKKALISCWGGLSFLTTNALCQGSTQINHLISNLSAATEKLGNNDKTLNPLFSELQREIGLLSDHLFDSKAKPDKLYLDILQDDYVILDSISRRSASDTSSNKILRELLVDFRIKNRSMGNNQLVEDYNFTMPVEVRTRKLINGVFVDVSGYKVFANPWLRRNVKPAKIVFNNSTNPGTLKSLPPGRYYIWVTPIDNTLLVFPKEINYSQVDYKTDRNKQVIYIDIN